MKIVVGPQIQIFECLAQWDLFEKILNQAGLVQIYNEDDGCVYCFDPTNSVELVRFQAIPVDLTEQVSALTSFKDKYSCTLSKIIDLISKQPDEMSVSYETGGRAPAEECVDIVWGIASF